MRVRVDFSRTRTVLSKQKVLANRFPGSTKRAISVNMQVLRLQSSEGKFTMFREIEPVRRSFCRDGSGTFQEVARLVFGAFLGLSIAHSDGT